MPQTGDGEKEKNIYQRPDGYWYRSERQDGVTRAVYVGRGALLAELAELEAEERAILREERRLHRLRWEDEKDRLKALDVQVHERFVELRRWAGTAMGLAGYQLHNRGWRKAAKAMGAIRTTQAAGTTQAPPSEPVTVATPEAKHQRIPSARNRHTDAAMRQFLDLTKEEQERIAGGERSDEASSLVLRKIMLRKPDLAAWLHGDLSLRVENNLLASLGDKLSHREAALVTLDGIRTALEGDNPTPLEQLLISRLVTCWCAAHVADLRVLKLGECSFSQAEYCQRAADRAHRRLMTAFKTLAQVRAVALPVLLAQIAQLTVAAEVNVNSTNNKRRKTK